MNKHADLRQAATIGRLRSAVVLYNRNRPHSSLGNSTPSEFAMKMVMEKQAA
ncbi:integrase core domain-containing protein [Xaviernesmea oryzae]|uniref:integrase core domain-containing protein n=1 Tax=Xaviernesmea oryzae TaxID=464029 RepID=UPI003076ADEC